MCSDLRRPGIAALAPVQSLDQSPVRHAIFGARLLDLQTTNRYLDLCGARFAISQGKS
jgi:hypothetical protein